MEILNKDYKEYKLENGLIVALQNTPTKTIYGILGVNWGVAHEKEGEEGLAHFIEHILPATETSKYSIQDAEKIRRYLGYFNAHTSVDETNFDSDFLSEYLEKYLDLTSSFIFSPVFNEKIIEQERQVILREISEEESRPNYNDDTDHRKKIYEIGHPYTLELSGKKSVIKSADSGKLMNFYSEGYNANNMNLVLVGGLPENIEELVKKYFADKPSGENKKIIFPLKQPLEKAIISHFYSPSLINQNNPDESNSHISIGIFVPPKTHKDRAKLQILSEILGGGQDSKLFNKLRNEKGLTYHVDSVYTSKYNTGIILINFKTPYNRQEEAIDSVFETFRELKHNLIDEDYLESKKICAEYAIGKHLETNPDRASYIRDKLKNSLTPEANLEQINSLNIGDIQEAAVKYLPKDRNDNYTMIIYNPIKEN